MKTKTLFAYAFLTFAAAIAVKAQTNAFSSNVVGVVNVRLTPGYHIVCNPLNAPDNRLNSLFPGVPGDQVFKFGTNGYTISTLDEFDLVWVPNLVVLPGEAVFYRASGNVTLTFVGELFQGTHTNSLPAGYSLRSSIIPEEGTLGPNAIGLPNLSVPGNPGDQVYKYESGKGYTISTFDEFDYLWVPNLTIKVGEGFFIRKGVVQDWVRVFSLYQ